MPSTKPLFEDYLLECLHSERYPQLLHWTDEQIGEFLVSLKRRNSVGWTVNHAAHYQGWDQVNYDHGSEGRKPSDDKQYYTDSRHRFKADLDRMKSNKVIVCVEDMDLDGLITYRFSKPVPWPRMMETPDSMPDCQQHLPLSTLETETISPRSCGVHTSGVSSVDLPEGGLLKFVTSVEDERGRKLFFYIDKFNNTWVSENHETSDVYLVQRNVVDLVNDFSNGMSLFEIINVPEAVSVNQEVSECFDSLVPGHFSSPAEDQSFYEEEMQCSAQVEGNDFSNEMSLSQFINLPAAVTNDQKASEFSNSLELDLSILGEACVFYVDETQCSAEAAHVEIAMNSFNPMDFLENGNISLFHTSGLVKSS